MGTPSSMAAEQAEGSNPDVRPAADVYTLGAILYELLTDGPPFRGASALETLGLIRDHTPVPPRAIQPSVPAPLETDCLKCLEKPATLRYATAGALADDLQRFLDGEPVNAKPPSLLGLVRHNVRHVGMRPRFRTWSRTYLALSPVSIGS
jgi:serine/threonine protein kinase